MGDYRDHPEHIQGKFRHDPHVDQVIEFTERLYGGWRKQIVYRRDGSSISMVADPVRTFPHIQTVRR